MTLRFWVLCLMTLMMWQISVAQNVTGCVTDAETGETLPSVNIYYEGRQGHGSPSDLDGNYSLPFEEGTLVFSMVGYQTQKIQITKPRNLNIKLIPDTKMVKEVLIQKKRQRYSRKNNPAVEMMKKVIAAKKKTDLRERPYFSYDKYQKLTFALNEVTEKVFQDDKFKRMPMRL